jgi:GWxTD domain-containing protein
MKEIKKNKLNRLSSLLILPILLLNSCGGSNQRLINDLPEDDREFYTYVRYIITRSEKKAFLSLTSNADRRQFREEFWKKRDPSPETDENEYKDLYFKRIEEANELFSRGGTKGWTTDRGRVHILLGPPETKRVYPTGYRVEDLPSEIWFYGYYPVIFVDRFRTGEYQLTSLGAWHLGELVKAAEDRIPNVAKVQNPYEFSLKLLKNKNNNTHNLQVFIPYSKIIFKEGKEGFQSDIKLKITIVELKKNVPQSMEKDHTIVVKAEDLDKLEKTHVISIPLKLEPGKYEATVIIHSEDEGLDVKDKIGFKI